MRARAFQGGDLDAFSAAFFQSGLLALGSRAPCPAASPACGGRSKRGQLAGRKGLPFAGANYTAGISLCLPAFRWWNHGGRNFGTPFVNFLSCMSVSVLVCVV